MVSTVLRIPKFLCYIKTTKNVCHIHKQIFTGFEDSRLPFSTAMLSASRLQMTLPSSAE
jgi:hypothetical protein